jgi:hypothetical protein
MAAYALARSLGVDAARPCIRDVTIAGGEPPGPPGISEEQKGVVARKYAGAVDEQSRRNIAMLDVVIGNVDRHSENAILQRGEDGRD